MQLKKCQWWYYTYGQLKKRAGGEFSFQLHQWKKQIKYGFQEYYSHFLFNTKEDLAPAIMRMPEIETSWLKDSLVFKNGTIILYAVEKNTHQDTEQKETFASSFYTYGAYHNPV